MLKRGWSKEIIGQNIATLRKENKPEKQAVAIALNRARQFFTRRHPLKKLPMHLTNAYRIKKEVIKKNPSLKAVDQAINLYQNFSGHKGKIIGKLEKPVIPNVVVAIGEVLSVVYETVRDGKAEKYIHTFSKRSRPLLAVSSDGKQMLMLGGAYTFTERGFEDER